MTLSIDRRSKEVAHLPSVPSTIEVHRKLSILFYSSVLSYLLLILQLSHSDISRSDSDPDQES